ncbi:MAG: hypothetical protein RSE46_16085, partial [Janthinobacterium sp.]
SSSKTFGKICCASRFAACGAHRLGGPVQARLRFLAANHRRSLGFVSDVCVVLDGYHCKPKMAADFGPPPFFCAW